ncbi:aldo/keto reductase [Paramicrobacterium chengjingii]|uniref:aldo/keto reductase n=1 Tax=Paramicrobacterium chengjingii TaxID=2769067 RepID=UPI002E282494|nr:aldo/keto reductase [Microbacterium chengjingii]
MAIRRALSRDLDIFPVALGTNVFGWTADESASHDVLNAYVEHGGNFLDTADQYSTWVDGNSGGESETIIGSWLAGRSDRDDLVIATKVSRHPKFPGLSASNVRGAVDASLGRLGLDHLDLYYAHFDDPSVPLEETIEAFSALVDAGKIRAIGISNYTADRIREWLRITQVGGYHAPIAIEPQYSLVERGIEADVLPLARENDIAVVPYYVLARGFLTGKYRGGVAVDSPRSSVASAYLDVRGARILDAVEQVAERHNVRQASVAIAWALGQPGVIAPIASARNLDQLPGLLTAAEIDLSAEELRLLDQASRAEQPS